MIMIKGVKKEGIPKDRWCGRSVTDFKVNWVVSQNIQHVNTITSRKLSHRYRNSSSV